MTVQQFLLILWARRKVALSVLAVTVLLALIFSIISPKQYTASTSLVIDVKSPDPIAGIVLQGLMAPGYMATQVDIINSDRVANRAVKLLGIEKDAEAIESWQKATEGKGSFESYYANKLQAKLDVRPSRESNVLNINFTAGDPQSAAAVANAFAQAYIDTSIELKVEPARQYTAWFQDRQKSLRADLEKAQTRLSAYQQDKVIILTDERGLDSETARLNELTSLLAAVQAQKADASSRQKSGTSELSQDVMQSPQVQNIKAELTKAESKLAEASSSLGKNHPQVEQLQAQVVALKQQLREEISRISGGAAVANKLGAMKQEELKAAIEEQKKRMVQLKTQRDELSVLANDVETAKRAYEAVGQRMTQTSLEGQSQQTNALILSPASEPLKHSRPRVLFNLIVASFLGTLLGIGVALILELGQRRIRSAEDIASLLELPVLAELDSILSSEQRKDWWFWRKQSTLPVREPVFVQQTS